MTLAELLFGIGIMPAGRRKDGLAETISDLMRLFEGRILPFDTEVCYAALAVKARAAGRGFPTPDGYIAAIAPTHEFAVATRDTGPFTVAGLSVLNPWLSGTSDSEK